MIETVQRFITFLKVFLLENLMIGGPLWKGIFYKRDARRPHNSLE